MFEPVFQRLLPAENLFAFLTGCRASEAFNLVWANVDFSRGCVTFTETKNHDTRTIPLTNPLD
jgi:integrase